MKSNPFYGLSASAMLVGCWLLSEALHLQAGQLGSLMVLMGILQLYEVLLVGLGAFLLRTGRAPRDGTSLLMLETLFLMDAPLLAAECVTADAGAGTAVALAALALAVGKLAWVRRAVPGVLPLRSAVVVGAQCGVALALPVAAAHLARAGLLGPHVLWLFWWGTLALPLAARRLGADAVRAARGGSTTALAAWSWAPAAMVLLHLWAVGYIHAISFQPAFLVPLLLGLASTSRSTDVSRQVSLPLLAVLLSFGQDAPLGFALPVAGDVSPLRVGVLGAAFAWAWLAWRDARRGMALLASGATLAAVVGAHGPGLAAQAKETLLRFLARALPRDAFGWGIVGIASAFVFLGAGLRRSLSGAARGAATAPRSPGRRASG